ncbi:hypothetical protein MMC07_003763 [Pseudocyphellaria aurata]|nr:hypothetical protein [Pseudocyphellaria aurata]
MKAFTISALVAILAAFAQAAPTPDPAQVDARQFRAQLTFEGATPDAFYNLSVPTDGSVFTINNPLIISHIKSEGGATCTISGTEGSSTTLVGATTVDVGPPQPQASGSCLAL